MLYVNYKLKAAFETWGGKKGFCQKALPSWDLKLHGLLVWEQFMKVGIKPVVSL